MNPVERASFGDGRHGRALAGVLSGLEVMKHWRVPVRDDANSTKIQPTLIKVMIELMPKDLHCWLAIPCRR